MKIYSIGSGGDFGDNLSKRRVNNIVLRVRGAEPLIFQKTFIKIVEISVGKFQITNSLEKFSNLSKRKHYETKGLIF